MLNIRRISARQAEVTRWQQRYHPERYITIPRGADRYFQLWLVSATEKIRALIPADSWCRFTYPELVNCAWQGLDDLAITDIFTMENQGKTFFAGHYRIDNLQIVMGINDGQPWLTLDEPALGTVLMASPLNQLSVRPPPNPLWANITQRIDWVLGNSHISASLLRSIALHDVLRIQQLQLCLTVAGRQIACFQKKQEGLLMVEEMIENPVQKEEVPANLHDDIPQEALAPFDLANISVQLTFVLGHSDIPLSELAYIQPGATYSIGADKEREVKVYANKQLVAEGELIYIGEEGELGLEITRLACKGQLG